jgi:hypothetical protein
MTLDSPMPFEPFPTDCLPRPLADLIREFARATCCDETFFALPSLAVIGGCIGTTRRIQIKSRWLEFPIVWTVIVSPSGTQKSAGIKEAASPLEAVQKRAFRDHDEAMELHRIRVEEFEASQKQHRGKSSRSDPASHHRPTPPTPRRFLVSDSTIEALAPILHENPRGVTMVRDELAGWFRSFDAYKSAKGGDVAQWLEMHGGRSLTVDRKGGEPRTLYVPAAAVSVTGSIQPGILGRILGAAEFESGFAARLLLAMPPRRTKLFTDAEISPSLLAGYQQLIERLLTLEHAPGTSDQPVDISMTPEARALFIQFYDRHAERQATAASEDLAAAFSKLEGYAARFALIIHFIRWASDDPHVATESLIDEESVRNAITLAEWFSRETERVYQELSASGSERERRELVASIRSEGGRISVRELHRANQKKYGSADGARLALQQLEERGFGSFVKPVNGGRPSEVFVLRDPRDTSDSDKRVQNQPPTSVTVTSVSAPNEVSSPVGNLRELDPSDPAPR